MVSCIMKKLISLVFIGVFFVGCKDQDKESPEDKGNNNSSQAIEEGPDLSGIEYNLSGDSAFITKCTRVGQVIVPSVIENVAVTGIGDNAFFGNIGMTSLVLPDSLASIGNSAFRGCIGITDITIPPNVNSIGISAFSGCRKLKTVKFLGHAPADAKYMFKDAPATLYFDPGKDGWDKPFGGRPIKPMKDFPG